MPRRAIVARSMLFGLTCTVAAVSVPLSAGREPAVDTVFYPVNAVMLGLAGLLIGLRLPHHRIGTLLVGLGLAAGIVELLEGFGSHDTWVGALTAQWVASWASLVGAGSTATLLACFPDGHAAGPRWRWLPAFTVLATAAMVFSAAFGHMNDDSYTFTRGGNPYAIDGLEAFTVVAECGFALSLLLSIASLAARFRRSAGVERQQLKLIFWFGCLLAVVGPAAGFAYHSSVLVQVAIALLIPLLPVTICVAILRYRLYDVDLLISRTLAWTTTTVLLAAAWGTTALTLGAILGGGSSWVTAGATLAAAAVFFPLRQRVQDAVDRTFRRARHASLAQIDAYLEDLRAGRASAEDLESLLRQVLHDPGLTLRLLLPGQSPTRGDDRTVVERSGVPLAEVIHSVPQEDPLTEVIARAGLAIEIARLQAEVNRQLAEVENSRSRIVAAAHDERRRLERDLHDGAQQRLVSAGLALRHVQHHLSDHPAVVNDIEDVISELTAAISDLRALANGVRPAGLEDGLDLALRDLAGRSPLPVRVSATSTAVPDAVAATAYFVAAEGLTNILKHAAAAAITLTAEDDGDDLVITVQDDGIGGASFGSGSGTGSGLRGLADRVAAVGGDLLLQSPLGAGTTLIVRLPCGS
ncbi:MAG: histidine kinase [Propionibacteriales bacterium]|nr:histidine kinase [Propionibacteriales bacterium]